MNYTTFRNEVTSGLIAKYDQQDLFNPLPAFSFNQYYSSNPETVSTIIKVYYNDLQGREDVQEYLIAECQTAIIEKATNNQQESHEISKAL